MVATPKKNVLVVHKTTQRSLNHLILCHQVLLKMNVMYQTVQPMVVGMKSHHILVEIKDLKSTGCNART
jgi:hypothetical protein